MLSLSDRGLILSVPVRMQARAIDTFLDHSRPWLRRHLPRWRANTAPSPELSALQRVLLLGEPLTIDMAAAAAAVAPSRRQPSPQVVRNGDRVSVTVADLGEAVASMPAGLPPDVVHVVPTLAVSASYRPVSSALRAAGLPKAGRNSWYLDADTGRYRRLTAAARSALAK
jgi:hypothetical protein